MLNAYIEFDIKNKTNTISYSSALYLDVCLDMDNEG